MAQKRKDATTSMATGPSTSAAPSKPSSPTTSSGRKGQQKSWHETILKTYLETTPQRTKLVDVFLAFLVAVGGVQFVYCVLAGNYPFNAFLSGFSATVGQFVLTASLRIQTTDANKSDFPSVSPESLILHFFCINFIN